MRFGRTPSGDAGGTRQSTVAGGHVPPADVAGLVERTFRDERARVLATLIRLLDGDFDAAEEAVSDALVSALETWPRDGLPRNPGAWLTTAARNAALDRVRRARRVGKLAALEAEGERQAEAAVRIGNESRIVDDRLRLIFTCCHPALPLDARVALTLRTLGGLTTPEIAHAFLVPEATLAQRLVRAQRKIREARIPYRVPPDELLGERLDGVLATLYLIFNEGYAASVGDRPTRAELSAEAIRLARLVVELMPDRAEGHGLLALLLLQDSRRDARMDESGIVLLEDQDRTRWDRAEIEEGLAELGRGWALAVAEAGAAEAAGQGDGLLWSSPRPPRPGPPASIPPPSTQPPAAGPYLLQATIAAQHARTVFGETTDWGSIAALYASLARVAPSPVVELNRAVALGMWQGPDVGLSLVDRLAEGRELAKYHLLHATRAELLRRLERYAEAADAYEVAIELATNAADRAFLERRRREMAGLR